jgi:hypothetical protein
MTLTPGATLARINGVANVWLEAAVPEAQAQVFAGKASCGRNCQRSQAIPYRAS